MVGIREDMKMTISLIAAMDRNRVIGVNNQLPWHLPADLAWFEQWTCGRSVLMGRKTYQSLGSPLPERQNIVLSHQNLTIDGVHCIQEPSEVDACLHAYYPSSEQVHELMVIGGDSIYQQYLPQAQRLYLTQIDTEVLGGDAYFPEWTDDDFECVERIKRRRDANNAHDMQFEIWQRKA